MAKETITRVPLGRLAESPMNPRRIRHDEADKELAASIKEQGVLAPLLIRKNSSNGKYEILAGSRRFRAAKSAGLKDVPTIVKDVDDKTALEIIIIENLQRADIHPLDEADGFSDLLEKSGGDLGAVSAKVNKDRRYIAKRARLSYLAECWRKEWLDPKNEIFGIAHAVELARLEPKRQKELHKSFRAMPELDDLRRAIDNNHLHDLNRVPWILTDSALHKKAGACNTCPKRTGSNADLFGDIKGGNTCTDRACFDEKFQRFADAWAAEAKKVKMKFHLLSEAWYSGSKKLLGTDTWKQVPKNKLECEHRAMGIMAETSSNRFGKVLDICVGDQKCKIHRGQNSDESSGSSRPVISKAERKKRITKNRNIRRQLAENGEMLTLAMEKWKFSLDGLKEIAVYFWERLWHDNRVKLAVRRGWVKERKEMGWNSPFDFQKDIISKIKSDHEIHSIMFESLFLQDLGEERSPRPGKDLVALCKRLKVNMKAVKIAVDDAEKKREVEQAARRKAKAEERNKLKAKAKEKANKKVRKAVAAKAKKLAKGKSK